MKKRFILTSIAIFTAWLLATLLLDSSPSHYPELTWPPDAIPPEQNGYEQMCKLWGNDATETKIELYADAIKDFRETPPPDELVTEFESALAPQFAEMVRLANMSDWQYLDSRGEVGNEPFSIQAPLDLMRLHSQRTEFALRKGRPDLATQLSTDQLLFSQKLTCGKGSLITFIVGASLYEQACAHLSEVVHQRKTSPLAIKQIGEFLKATSIPEKAFSDTLRAEYCFAVKELSMIKQEKSPLSSFIHGSDNDFYDTFFRLSIKPNQTAHLYADHWIRFISDYEAGIIQYGDSSNEENWSLGKKFIFGNYGGRTLYESLIDLPRWHQVEKAISPRVCNDLVRIQCACELYRLDKGHYPESLHDLSADFANIPLKDRFGLANYGYDPEKGIIYSIGSDQINSNGVHREEENSPLNDDQELVVYLRYPQK